MPRTQYKMDTTTKNGIGGCLTIIYVGAALLFAISYAWWTDQVPQWVPWVGDDVAQVEKPPWPAPELDAPLPQSTPDMWRAELPADLRNAVGTAESLYAVDVKVCNQMEMDGRLETSLLRKDCLNAIAIVDEAMPTLTPDVAYEGQRGGNVAIYLTAEADVPNGVIERLEGALKDAVESSAGTMWSLDPRDYRGPTPIRGWQPRTLYEGGN